ncbi:hypothetical protein [Mesorhizobium captivum]|uniref:hypothetical protein n=1 Tax=Mesorhizobium captivum TaxID=3072319 RepID=UPI002A246D63|nr:hypothetical protein [Mesorhizobium sp. VK22E]MDX8507289.1 hypothetical protein [Mesorhizobium sp. VK22E]
MRYDTDNVYHFSDKVYFINPNIVGALVTPNAASEVGAVVCGDGLKLTMVSIARGRRSPPQHSRRSAAARP